MVKLLVPFLGPLIKEVYEPILKELEEYGIHFKEEEVEYLGYNSAGGVSG